jgi:predicted Zn-dependent peptidase
LKATSFIFVVSVSIFGLTAGGWAQETQGIGQTNTSVAVIKGHAPVAKNLLTVRLPKPKSFTLKNGLTVYVLEDHRMPAVRLSLQLRAGAVYEPKPAVADLTAAMLTEGTTSKNYVQLSDATENMGTTVGAGSGLDMATVTASGLSENFDATVDVWADVLLHPSFPKDRLDNLKFAQRGAARQRRSNPAAVVAELQSKIFYGGTKFERTPATPEETAAVSTDDLVAFYQAYYVPNGAILGVTGDVNFKHLKEKLESALADWKPGAATAELPSSEFTAPESPQIYLIDRPRSAQTVLQFGVLAVKQSDPDYIPLVVANRILGGGSSGRLFQNIRERKGYTYGAYSSLGAGKWATLWGANANVRTAVTEPAIGEFFYEFKRLQTELVPADEMERAKRSIVGAFALRLESPEQVLASTLELVQNGLPLDYWDTYPAKIAAVTPEDVQRVSKKYLAANRIQLMAVGERSSIEAGLAKYGPVKVVDTAHLAAVR